MAMISVPPLEAPILNRIADPIAGRKIAKTSSSIGSVVSGTGIGQIRSNADSPKDMSMLA